MPDVPILPEPERDEEFADKLVALRNRLDDVAHVALTGDTTGRVRRKVLFLIAAFSILALARDGIAGIVIGGVGLIALLMLAMTDDVVDLS